MERDELDGSEPELIKPEDFLPPNPFPKDAQRMGFDRYSGGDAGFLAIASALDGRKRSHRLFATFLLVAVVTSLAMSLWGQFTFGR